MNTKAEMLGELKAMLGHVLLARTKGAAHPRLARAHGLVDGYMKALIETGVATEGELLSLVARERTLAHGPSLLEIAPSPEAG